MDDRDRKGSARRIGDIRPRKRPEDFSYSPEALPPAEPPVVTEDPYEISKSPVEPRAEVRRIARRVLWSILSLVLVGGTLVIFAKETKDSVLRAGESGYGNLTAAEGSLKAGRFPEATRSIAAARNDFARASDALAWWGGSAIDLTRFVPGLSRAASGWHAINAGGHFASAADALAGIAASLGGVKEAYTAGQPVSFLDFLSKSRDPLRAATRELAAAKQDLDRVSADDLPSDKRADFTRIRTALPVLVGLLDSFGQREAIVRELLGANGPRKYLFLLQNNDELRATGGFIGSYAVLDVNNGVIRNFFLDGIFNPDGQLKENIVPPKPIQKVSAAWSLHDSNWYPDFPTSAEKAIFFYEKTGGPTVDGVVTLTPTVMQKLLVVTGPIGLPDYGLTVDADNFVPIIQEQVEVKYDKVQNAPKRVLADLSTLLIQKVFASRDPASLTRVAEALAEGLNEKHILLYARDPQVERLVDQAGWSGRLLDTSKDFLSVVHSNVNGYKTDGVIDESIRHSAEIASDGSIVDTVAITRTHRGGDTPYAWWNRVNADYLRVYVPLGSELLSAKGATWEFPDAPLDYDALGFKRDAAVVREESGTRIDEKSGTRISEESGKTVFGAWVYVSPKESVTVEYRYKLPFRLDTDAIRNGRPDTYSALYQKQSGTPGSALVSRIGFPQGVAPIWQTGANLVPYGRTLSLDTTLSTDAFVGAVFGSLP